MHFELHDITTQNRQLGTRVAILGGTAGIETFEVAWRKLQQVAHAARAFQYVFCIEGNRVLALLEHAPSGAYRYIALARGVDGLPWQIPFKNPEVRYIDTIPYVSGNAKALTVQADSFFRRHSLHAALAMVNDDGYVHMAWLPAGSFMPSVIAQTT